MVLDNFLININLYKQEIEITTRLNFLNKMMELEKKVINHIKKHLEEKGLKSYICVENGKNIRFRIILDDVIEYTSLLFKEIMKTLDKDIGKGTLNINKHL